MTKDQTPPESGKGTHRATTPGHRQARAEALQRALRDNLRRRKAAATGAPEPPAPVDDVTRKIDE
jgi:hypothetical protein